MAPRTILDTDIFSELMRGKNEVVRTRADAYLKQHGRFTISAITVLEVAKGLHKARREDALARFIQGSNRSTFSRWRAQKRSSVVVSTATWSDSGSPSAGQTR